MSPQRTTATPARIVVPGAHVARVDTPASATDTASRCASILASGGPVDALRFLNARTRFRFTGIYRADPPVLRNVWLFDRENPTLNVSGEVCPLEETYCAIVAGSQQPLRTADARRDARLTSHAAREHVISYCGVPIRRDDGLVWGTLCHFDVRPRLLARSEIEVLEAVAEDVGRLTWDV
ncbi:MAG TPA: GAF domain-containing protein [Gemmatimonadaceae bacterium]|nr:GAF domain-containing protein [Gemmatimonadaceae bacterium]